LKNYHAGRSKREGRQAIRSITAGSFDTVV